MGAELGKLLLRRVLKIVSDVNAVKQHAQLIF
jgi:hypothetical protein